ncbi:MAG: flotillin family protein [Deltaproteobacteria bacterium]|nr:MAG: flotillin family protein [Deltaproteobacteria bacterium]
MIFVFALVFGVITVVGLALLIAGISVASSLLHICQPNQVLVLSGTGPNGFRTVRGGRAWRVPLIEVVDRLDLTNMIIDVSVTNAYSAGGIPLNVQGVANIKIASHAPLLDNAVERLLHKRRNEIMRIAKEVLEGNLRGVLSKLTPEQVNDDKLAFAEKLLDEAEDDLSALGLVLDTMKIQNVSDDRGYLDSIGRKKSAQLQRSARIAEANARALAAVRDASNRQRARLQEIEARTSVVEAESERRFVNAQTRGRARMAEEIGKVDAEIERVESAIEAAEAQVEQTRRRLEADVIAPAHAEMEARIAEARGHAAQIIESGRATIKVLEEMIAVWKLAGDDARQIFLMQKLQPLVDAMAQTIGEVKVEKLTMLPPGETASAGRQAARLVEELKGAIGVDLPEVIDRLTEKGKR